MAIRKYTTLLLDTESAVHASAELPVRVGRLEDFEFTPVPGFLYVTTRAISSRVNANHDGWPPAELRKSYRTFIGRPTYVDHNNWDLKRSRGVIIDSKLYETKLASGHEDTFVQLLIEVDAVAFPKLAEAILSGDIDAVSMGADVEYTVCSVCNNTAHDILQYCAHIPQMKGRTVATLDTKTGSTIKKFCYEDCYGVSFFEISFVFDPADESALISDVMLASAGNRALAHIRTTESIVDYSRRMGTSLEKVASTTAPAFCFTCGSDSPTFAKEGSICSFCGTKTADKVLMSLPQEVDTLRDELNCPQCGSEWNGMICTNCGFELPPEGLGDPNTDPFGIGVPMGAPAGQGPDDEGDQGQEEDDEGEDPKSKADKKHADDEDSDSSPFSKSDSKDKDKKDDKDDKSKSKSKSKSDDDDEDDEDSKKGPPKSKSDKSDKDKKSDKDTKSKGDSAKSKDDVPRSKKDDKSGDNAKKKKSAKEEMSVSRFADLTKEATLPQDPTYRQDTSPAQSVPPYGQAIPGGNPPAGFEPALEPAPAAVAEVRDLDAPDVSGAVGQSEVDVVNQPAGPTSAPPAGPAAGAQVNKAGSQEEKRAAFYLARAEALRERAAEFEKKAETVTQTDVRNLDEPPAVDVGADATVDLLKAVEQGEQLALADTTDVINDGAETGLPMVRQRLPQQVNPFNDASLRPYGASVEAPETEESAEEKVTRLAAEAKVREDQRVAAAKTRVLRIANFVDERIDMGLTTPGEKFTDIDKFEEMDDATLDGYIQATREIKAKESKVASRRVRVAASEDRGPIRMPSLGSASAPAVDDEDPADDYLTFLNA